MPRRSPIVDDGAAAEIENPLALPVPHPTHHREKEIDPYQAPPGAVANVSTRVEPIKRKATAAEEAQRSALALEQQQRGVRYDDWLDALGTHGGDQISALVEVYGCSQEFAIANKADLLQDVRSGIGSSKLAEKLERADLSIDARVRILRKHAYSVNPAASLKALDMVDQMDDDRSDRGSFESYLQVIRSARKR